MTGAIQWGDLSPVIAAIAGLAGALWFLWSKIDGIRAIADRKVEASREQTLTRVEAVRADLTGRVEGLRDEIVTVRLEMAREYASMAAVTAVEERLTDTLEKLGDKFDDLVREVVGKRSHS
ncbi:hypothetical protein [Labrys neptuniae]